jgi:uncharacterized membrane protein YfcA
VFLAVVGAVAFLASALTLYSGFGLGTVMLPVFALFFPVPVAVAATAVVHLLNNLFKGSLLRRQAEWGIVARFGVPAVPAAIAGAWLLSRLDDTSRLFEWSAGARTFGPTGAGLTIGALMIVLGLLEMQPWFQGLAAPPRLMPLGGLLTGFLGGLTGHQGAFRSMFLLKSGLDPARFIATGVMIAVIVDLSRIPTYAAGFAAAGVRPGPRETALVAVATTCACAGAYLGIRHMKKATHRVVRAAVVAMMMLVGGALIAGLLGS